MAERRKAYTRAQREKVHRKCNGHCAYCGTAIALEEMTIDHYFPLRKGGADAMVNLMPACRSCNQIKATYTIEQFRAVIQRWPDVLRRNSSTYRNAVRWGLVTASPRKVKFYFETMMEAVNQ